jgi:hypothetical protein
MCEKLQKDPMIWEKTFLKKEIIFHNHIFSLHKIKSNI